MKECQYLILRGKVYYQSPIGVLVSCALKGTQFPTIESRKFRISFNEEYCLVLYNTVCCRSYRHHPSFTMA